MSIRNELLERILSAIGGGGSVLWGSISGTISSQTDLADVAKTNDYIDLDNKPDLSNNYAGGFFDYNDLATTTTPIAVTSASDVALTNDELGFSTNKAFPPTGVTDIWNAQSGSFDWSELSFGDMIDIRIDVDVITTSVNTEIKIDLLLGTGAGSYSIPWILETNFKATGTHKLNRYNGIYVVDANTRDNGGKFMISTDKDCAVVVNGWYCKVIKRG